MRSDRRRKKAHKTKWARLIPAELMIEYDPEFTPAKDAPERRPSGIIIAPPESSGVRKSARTVKP